MTNPSIASDLIERLRSIARHRLENPELAIEWHAADVIERLLARGFPLHNPKGEAHPGKLINPDGPEAADALSQLTREVEVGRKALEDIREATSKRQLPLTDQIYRRCEIALEALSRSSGRVSDATK